MTTTKQREAARENIKKAQAKRKSALQHQPSLTQPEIRKHAKPGTESDGNYFRIIVRSKDEFATTRDHDAGEPDSSQSLPSKRSSGPLNTQSWLISKKDAHVEHSELIPDSQDTKNLFEHLSSKPVHEKGDVFTANDHRNLPGNQKTEQ